MIVDSPPILAVTDPAILSSVVDGVILVVRANKLRLHDAEATLERMESLGSGVLGMIVNETVQELPGYGYGHEYGAPHANGAPPGKSRSPAANADTSTATSDAPNHRENGHSPSILYHSPEEPA